MIKSRFYKKLPKNHCLAPFKDLPTATNHRTDSLDNDIIYPDHPDEHYDVTVDVEVPVEGRWTGGGTISWEATIPEGAHVTHGFQFHCDLRRPNRLEVNWTGGKRWHMMELLAAECVMNPNLPLPDPPEAPINEVFAIGEGRYNNARVHIAYFYFTDVGEPGLNDFAWIMITAPDGTVVLQAEGTLLKGNH